MPKRSVGGGNDPRGFFKALKNIDRFRGECRLDVWLCQIAKNTYFSYEKKQKRNVDLENAQIYDNTFEDKLCDRESAVSILSIVHRLPDPYKEVFWMRTFCDLSFAEIGSIHSKSESWARVTYHRARMKIKEALDKEDKI